MNFGKIIIQLENGKTVTVTGNDLSSAVKKKLNKEIQRFIQPRQIITEPSYPKGEI